MDEPLQNPVTLVNCTFSGNTNGAVNHKVTGNWPNAERVRIINSIFADTVGSGNVSNIEDWGYNLSTDGSIALTNATSLKNTDPMLGPLENNGGPTLTLALYIGSPAINAGNLSGAPPTDQRGVLRPFGAASDIGAFEGGRDPANPSGVRFALANYFVGEQAGTAGILIERDGASHAIEVGFSAAAGTASAGTDFVATNVTVSFAEGEMSKSVWLAILQNTEAEVDETVLLTLHDPVGTVLSEPSTATLTIVDDDPSGQIITNLTDSSLRAAVHVGGLIQFALDGTLLLTNSIDVIKDTILDAGGHAVTISGGNAVRLFNVGAGVALTIANITMANGRAAGVDGGPEFDGGEGKGGAILVNGGELVLLACRVWTNNAVGGKGGNGNSDPRGTRLQFGSGGDARAGAIYLEGGVLNATDCEFVGNAALGGNGGVTASMIFPLPPPKKGGKASGGAIFNHDGIVRLNNCTFSMNEAIGGGAPYNSDSSFADISGDGNGGVLFNDGGTVAVTNCSFTLNRASSTEAIGASLRATGSTNSGGALYNLAGEVRIVSTEFATNAAVGGHESKGNAGEGLGGAIFNMSQMQVSGCDFVGNQAEGGGYANARSADGNGGAIMNGGSLQVDLSHFKMNSAVGGHGYSSAAGRGGAIHNTNQADVNNSTFEQNAARGLTGEASFAPPSPAFGGALSTFGFCFLTNVTLAGNVARGGDVRGTHVGANQTPGDAFEGAVFASGGTAAFANCTFSENGAFGGKGPQAGNFGMSYGGGLCSTNGAASLANTVIANSTKGGNCFGTLSDLGHNLSSDGSCNFSGPGSSNNTDPKLGPLGDYGGPTPTIPLLAGSPAIDTGDTATSPPADQRGRARPFGTTSDIGAFESSPPYTVAGSVSGFNLSADVSVAAGAFDTTTTNRHYSVSGFPAGTYSVSPSDSDFVFYPTNRMVTVGPDQVGVDFKAYRLGALTLDGYENRNLQLIYAGTNGQTIRLLASTNLASWFPISTNTIGSSNLLGISITTIPTAPRLFFRTSRD